MSRSKRTRRSKDGLPLVALVGLAFGLFAFYLAAEMILQGRPHLWHWGILLIGAVLGYGAGMLWYRRKGDIV